MPDKVVEWIVKFKHRGWITQSEIVHDDGESNVNIAWSDNGKKTVEELLSLFEQIQSKASFLMLPEDFMWLMTFLRLCTTQDNQTGGTDLAFVSALKLQGAKYDTNERVYKTE